MLILGIETSCDETSVAIIEADNNKLILKSNTTATSLDLHAKTGGIIPEIAARKQLEYMLPVLHETLEKIFGKTKTLAEAIAPIDAIAVTYGPGLIGSLLVGVETAKTLVMLTNKPLIPVNHMMGHIYANFISEESNLPPNIEFPALALVVSGGHTDLLLLKKHGDYEVIGGTRDDAAGEAFDKIGRLLGLPYPAGPIIETLAKKGDPKQFRFPRPLIGSDDFDFSFSGLKTAVLREVQSLKNIDEKTTADLARATQDAIIDVLIKKTFKAAKQYETKSILLSGGVAANQTLRDEFKIQSSKFKAEIFAPQKSLCTDNGAMIAAAAYFNYHPVPWKRITVQPELYY